MTTVVLLSGGLDSTTVLWWSIQQGETPIALSVDYGQRAAETERRLAASIAHSQGVKHIHLAVPLVATVTRSALTATGDVAVPADTVVPGRNALLIALGAGLAQSIGANSVQIGCNLTDATHYPDCRHEFILRMDQAMKEAYNVNVLAPLLAMDKAQVVRWARVLGVPIATTSSCYRGTSCGECVACLVREAAINQAT